MELRQLNYFVTVAEELHFGHAAERLHIVQPAVSQQVRRLERELGVDLFDRSSRHVRLTEAGQRFLPEARAVLAATERARNVVTDPDRAGPLRLGTSTGLGDELEHVLENFTRLAPQVRVELVSAPDNARLERVRAGQLDAAFVRGPHDVLGLRFMPLWDAPLVAALPARHPLATADEVRIADLAGLPLRLVARPTNPQLYDLVVTACQDSGTQPLFGAPSHSLQNTLLTIGTGTPTWTVLYAAHARMLRTPKVSFRPTRPRLAMTTYLAVADGAPTPHLPALLAACTETTDRPPADHDH